MAAIVTDQFRIINTTNFIESVENPTNSYYVFLGLPNPETPGFGRDENWDRTDIINPASAVIPNPVDNFDYLSHYGDTTLFGKKITSANIRRVVRKIQWTKGVKYDMYRHDYSTTNLSSITKRSRLYDSNFYVINSDYKVYICIDNGSSGINTSGNASQDEPTFTDLEPSKAGESGDGYLWKYLFTVSPSDIIKFDSTEYITVPNNWSTTADSQIVSVRENGDSQINNNQIKKVYIDNSGSNYNSGEVDILGDGVGGRVFIETNANGEITNTTVTSGGKGYSYGIVDLGILQPPGSISNPAKLIPIIPPSRGHGYDIYKELGTDKLLIYSRFDDSTKDFPIDTKFAQIGIVKNPTKFISTEVFSESQFSGLYAIKLLDASVSIFVPVVGEKIQQSLPSGGRAVGYVASYDSTTKVLKYFKDRSLYYRNSPPYDQTDYIGISTNANEAFDFSVSGGAITGQSSGFSGSIDTGYSGITTVVNTNIINLGVQFTQGLANPEINKTSGEIIYIDNRPLVSRNLRQKEDVKIILEF
jgi:hypothetical protein